MDINRKQWRRSMKQCTSEKVWKFLFVCSSYFPGVQPFPSLSVTSWSMELLFFPLCCLLYKILNYLLSPGTLSLLSSCLSTKYWISYFFSHIFTALSSCVPSQGQISVLRAVCFSTAWIEPWGQGLFPWSIKCYVLATGSEEEVGKESGRPEGICATLLKCGKRVGWPGSFEALTPDVFSRAVLVHWGISWF